MSSCWNDGDLRAHVDQELAPDIAERLAAHLQVCSGCEARYDELAGRASRISALMDGLADGISNPTVRRAPVPMPARVWPRRIAVAAGIAAAIVIAVVTIERRQAERVAANHVAAPQTPRVATLHDVPSRAPAVLPVRTPVPARTEGVPRVRTASARPVSPRRSTPQSRIVTEDFVALDNQPFETGLVVRMALGPDEVIADVVFSPDGKARAYRLVDAKSN